MTKQEWAGLDHKTDYPNVIGNSTTKHVEYLVNTYHDTIKKRDFLKAYIYAAVWTLAVGRDPGRRNEVSKNLLALGLADIFKKPEIRRFIDAGTFDEKEVDTLAAAIAGTHTDSFRISEHHDEVRAAVGVAPPPVHDAHGLA